MRDYLSEMLYALTSAYTDTDYKNRKRGFSLETNIGKLFSIFAWGLDSVQEQADLIKLWDDLDYAKGSVLDRYGLNFGVKRFGATDEFYRLAIKVKLLSQLSGGDIDTVLSAAASLFDVPADRVDLAEVFPAKVSVSVNEDDLSPETLAVVVEISEMIKRILAAGVGLITTLRKYREFEKTTPVETALFDRTQVKFGLQDVRHKTSENTGIAAAAFERSQLTFDLPDARRVFTAGVQQDVVLFEQVQLRTEPAPPNPQVFRRVESQAYVLFERSCININPCY